MKVKCHHNHQIFQQQKGLFRIIVLYPVPILWATCKVSKPLGNTFIGEKFENRLGESTKPNWKEEKWTFFEGRKKLDAFFKSYKIEKLKLEILEMSHGEPCKACNAQLQCKNFYLANFSTTQIERLSSLVTKGNLISFLFHYVKGNYTL